MLVVLLCQVLLYNILCNSCQGLPHILQNKLNKKCPEYNINNRVDATQLNTKSGQSLMGFFFPPAC